MSNERMPRETERLVLMVDDDPDDVFLTKRAFKAIQWEGQFESLENAYELFAYLGLGDGAAVDTAIDRSDSKYPDIIILDLNMPGINGFDVLERIRAHTSHSQLPIVVLSTSDLAEDVQKAYTMGANSYITKPVSNEEMIKLAGRFRDYWFGLTRLPDFARV